MVRTELTVAKSCLIPVMLGTSQGAGNKQGKGQVFAALLELTFP